MSIAAQLAQNTTIYIAGSTGSAATLTAVTVGNPTILAITGHTGVMPGDVVVLAGFTGADAASLNGLSVVVTHYTTGATNDTFAVDINTLGKTITIGAGTATPAAWVPVRQVKTIKPGGASATKLDVTDLNSTGKEYRSGLIDNGTCACEIFILESDPGQAACLSAFTTSTVVNMKHVTSAKTRTFSATILKFPTVPDGAVDSVQTGSFEFQINGSVTVA
jgi:hypothetical protein